MIISPRGFYVAISSLLFFTSLLALATAVGGALRVNSVERLVRVASRSISHVFTLFIASILWKLRLDATRLDMRALLVRSTPPALVAYTCTLVADRVALRSPPLPLLVLVAVCLAALSERVRRTNALASTADARATVQLLVAFAALAMLVDVPRRAPLVHVATALALAAAATGVGLLRGGGGGDAAPLAPLCLLAASLVAAFAACGATPLAIAATHLYARKNVRLTRAEMRVDKGSFEF